MFASQKIQIIVKNVFRKTLFEVQTYMRTPLITVIKLIKIRADLRQRQNINIGADKADGKIGADSF